MGRVRGRTVGLSRARRLVMDYMHLSRKAATVAVERHVNIAEVAAARLAAQPRPGWFAILLKAYGLAAHDLPDLRRSLLTFPWLRLYEHTECTALVTVERELDGEPAVFTYPLRRPGSKSLLEINTELHRLRTVPLQEVRAFRNTLLLLRFPRPIRRFLMWLALDVRGAWRDRFSGTFAASNIAPDAAITFAFSAHSTFFTPVPIDADGNTTLRLFVDHRVMDGSHIVRALCAIEAALRGAILDELRSLAPPLRAGGNGGHPPRLAV